MDTLDEQTNNAAAMDVDHAAETSDGSERNLGGATLPGRQIKFMEGGKELKATRKKTKKQIAAEAAELSPSKPGRKRPPKEGLNLSQTNNAWVQTGAAMSRSLMTAT